MSSNLENIRGHGLYYVVYARAQRRRGMCRSQSARFDAVRRTGNVRIDHNLRSGAFFTSNTHDPEIHMGQLGVQFFIPEWGTRAIVTGSVHKSCTAFLWLKARRITH
ncbi:MAG: hypothetical protein JOZ62_21565 [Acidobacteriaceae bacterium]|nr:hypothetical protein [Acidobacteriaceae bacterium]